MSYSLKPPIVRRRSRSVFTPEQRARLMAIRRDRALRPATNAAGIIAAAAPIYEAAGVPLPTPDRSGKGGVVRFADLTAEQQAIRTATSILQGTTSWERQFTDEIANGNEAFIEAARAAGILAEGIHHD